MKVLLLVRHAKSSWDDPSLDDVDRPLGKRGKKDAPEMGERLKKRGIMPDILLSSPAKRARSTAKKIAKRIGYPREKIRIVNEIYEGGPDRMLDILKNIPDDPGSIMLFGHNPDITEFANLLSGINIYNIPTCGIVSIHFQTDDWQQVDYKKGELIFFDYPKKISDTPD